MSFCCFPKIKCLNTKNKIQTRSESEDNSDKHIRSVSSNGKLNSTFQKSNIKSSIFESYLPSIAKPLNESLNHRSLSHKSNIVVRSPTGFEPISAQTMSAAKVLKKPQVNQMDSLSISRISAMSIGDNSGLDFLDEFNRLERAIHQDNGRVQKIYKSKKLFKEFVIKKREAPPIFLKNPCFGMTENKQDHE